VSHGSKLWRPGAGRVAEPAELPDRDHEEGDDGGGGEGTGQRQTLEQPRHSYARTMRGMRVWFSSCDLLLVFVRVCVCVEPKVLRVRAQEASPVRTGW
jgi:hypothetical protein